MELKGSKTEANLQAAFAGESMARNKYTYYASQAKKEGYEQIADIFLETAENEKEHAKLWFKALHDNKVPKTIENLKDAASGENYEYTTMYKEFAETAREEGFTEIAALFEAGNAATADTSTSERRPPPSVPCASTPSPSSRSGPPTGDSQTPRPVSGRATNPFSSLFSRRSGCFVIRGTIPIVILNAFKPIRFPATILLKS